MSFRYSLLILLGLGNLCAVAGCSSDAKSGGDGGPGGGAGGGTAAATCDTIDYASYMTGAPKSLKNDLMPIFGRACTASDCHNTHDKKAGLNLGVKCNYDLNTKTCPFPAAPDPNDMSPNPAMPLTPAVLTDTYASLKAPAMTVTSVSVLRVTPGDPEHSFLIQKVSGKQNAEGYTCTNQDPSHSTVDPPLACGDLMPLGSTPLCEGTTRADFDNIARWIAQGALNN